jgi:arylsulfatase A-like enzyme
MRLSPLAAALLALALPLSAQNNILVILADDLGLADVGAYNVGNDQPSTPAIDSLAANGVRFRRAWSYPFCSPSRVALQTGRYGYRSRVGHLINQNIGGQALAPSEITLPEMLDLGTSGAYTHGAFGKWHMGNKTTGDDSAPNIAGYGTYKGVLVGEPNQYFVWTAVHDGVQVPQSGYLTVQTATDVIDFIATAPEPWFCYAAFHAPHTPLHKPPGSLHTTEVPPTDPIIGSGFERAHFKAMVEALDSQIGAVLAALGPALANTTVILASDNGTSAGWIAPPYSSQKAKSTLFQGGVNVPLIVYDPAVTAPGSVSNALVHLVDVFATVAEVAGVDLPQTMGGVALDSLSLMPHVLDPTRPSTRTVLYTEHFSPNGFGPFDYYRKTARNSRFKLLQLESGNFLYELSADPYETVNLLEGPLLPYQASNYAALRLELLARGVDRLPTPFIKPFSVPTTLPDPK